MALPTVYSSPKCVDCKATYRSLEKKGLKEGVDFNYVDVTKDEEALQHVLSLGYSKVPVVETDTEHWMGHRPDKIIALAANLAAAA